MYYYYVLKDARDRYPVVVYKTYCEKRPAAMNTAEAPFYLGINHINTPSSGKSWFKANPMGVNKLKSLMKDMATRAGLDCQRLTNHSARKRMVQKLNGNDIPSILTSCSYRVTKTFKVSTVTATLVNNNKKCPES